MQCAVGLRHSKVWPGYVVRVSRVAWSALLGQGRSDVSRPRICRVAALLSIAAVLGILTCYILQIRVYYITSDSMSPMIPQGSVIVTKATDFHHLKVGDVVTVKRDDAGRTVTHRVIEIAHDPSGRAIRLQGDANLDADAGAYRFDSAQLYLFKIF